MHAFSYAWSLPVTWQRWRSHRSIHRGQLLHPHGSVFYRTGVMTDRSFTLREYGVWTLAPVPRSDDPDGPMAPDDLRIRTWPVFLDIYRMCKLHIGLGLCTGNTGADMNFLCQGFRKLSSKSDRQTRPKFCTPLAGGQ